MKKKIQNPALWFYGLTIIFVLLLAFGMTWGKAKQVKEDFHYHIWYDSIKHYNSIVSGWSTMSFSTFYCPDADYFDYSGVWIELNDGDGNKVELSDYVLELCITVSSPEGDQQLPLLAPIPYSVINSKWTYTNPNDDSDTRTWTVEEILKHGSCDITASGTYDGILASITELSIDVGRFVKANGGDGTNIPLLNFTFPESNSSGKDFLFMSYSSLNHYYSLEEVSNLNNGSLLREQNEENYAICEEAKSFFLEKPFLKPGEGDLREEGGLFTYVLRENLFDDDSVDMEADSAGCVLSAVYVTHPVRVAMSKLWVQYIILAYIGGAVCTIYYWLNKSMQKKIKKYERSRTAITRFAAHELKTPLAVIRIHAVSLAEEENDPDIQKIKLDGIVKQADTATVLVEDLLELSRLEAAAKTPSPEIVDLTQLTHVLLRQIEPLTKDRQVTVTAPDGECLISADLSMMRTVLMNFLTNAVRYSRSFITVTVSREKKNIRWTVSNDGTTIPEEDLDHVWDAFYTVDESHSKKNGGTGLGLTITKQLLDLHKAKYGCTSNPAETTFFFMMPEVAEVSEGTAK